MTAIEILQKQYNRILSIHNCIKRTCDKESLVLDERIERTRLMLKGKEKELRLAFNSQYIRKPL